MYTVENFKTKKALKEAIDAGLEILFYQPGPFGGAEPEDGIVYLEGPHYPEPHKWYCKAEAKGGRIVKLLK